MIETEKVLNRFVLYGILLLVFFSPFVLGTANLPWVTFVEVTILFLFSLRVFNVLQGGRLVLSRSPVHVLLFCLLAVAGLQLLIKAFFPNLESWGTVYVKATQDSALKLASYCLLFWLVLLSVQSEEQVSRILKSIVSVAFLISLVGILQKLSGTNKILWVKETGYGTGFFGTFVNPNHFAAFVGTAIFLGFGRLLYLHARYDRSTSGKHAEKTLLFYFLVVMVSAHFFSLSRSAMVFFTGTLFFFYLWVVLVLRKKGPLFLVTFLVVSTSLMLLWIGIGDVLAEFSTLFSPVPDPGIQARLVAWKTVLRHCRDFPWFGTGLGTFQYVFAHYKPESLFGLWRHVHNEWIQVLSEMGIPGFLLSATLAGFFFFRGLELRRAEFQADPYVKYVGLGCFAALIYLFGMTIFDFPLRTPANAILLVVTSACLLKMKDFIDLGKPVKESVRGSVPLLDPKSLSRRKRSSTASKWSGLIMLSLFLTLASLILCPYFARAIVESAGKGSVPALQQAIRLDPSNAELHFELGLAMGEEAFYDRNRYNQEKMGSAFAAIERALALNPWNAKYYYGLAFLAQKMKDNEAAAHYFERAIALEPSNPFYHLYFAIFCFNRAFIQAETLDDFSGSPYLVRGVIAYKKAREIYPDLKLANYQDYLIDYVRVNNYLHRRGVVSGADIA